MTKLVFSVLLVLLCSCENGDLRHSEKNHINYSNNHCRSIKSISHKTRNFENVQKSQDSENHKIELQSQKTFLTSGKAQSSTAVECLNPTSDIPDHVTNIAKSKIPPVNEFDKIAMQMIGKYVPEELKHSRKYYAYLQFFEKAWSKLQKNSISQIPAWVEKNINPLISDILISNVDSDVRQISNASNDSKSDNSDNQNIADFSAIDIENLRNTNGFENVEKTNNLKISNTVFYPFGGPDISYVLSFFTNADTYILVGLEPIGTFENIKKVINLPETYDYLANAMKTYLRGGYFITSEMLTNLSTEFLRGTLYLILLQLSVFDFEINNIENLSINEDGEEVLRGKSMLDCVKITFEKKEENQPRVVYYIRADLSDNNHHLKNLFNFMRKFSFYTFFKSASYAIWDKSLSNVRKFILDNSKFILQDDTGIPFSKFENKKWEKYAFGSYTEPHLSNFFRKYIQPDMAEFFKNNQKAQIPFKIGYGFYQSTPNLLLAIRKIEIKNDKNVETKRLKANDLILNQTEQNRFFLQNLL